MFEDTGLYSQMRILVVSQKSCIFYVSYTYTDIQQYDAIEARIRTERIRYKDTIQGYDTRIRYKDTMLGIRSDTVSDHPYGASTRSCSSSSWRGEERRGEEKGEKG